ncbi:condensation domain-containing protein [Streptomyces sp. DH10]|uniref:condensation domain-containing protein n=1 Tax=Streptomyces sp. DH10 TaxID=3040121 RepID=UPI0024435A17|nr:condensation domain-containing protein [Streptomyces sp. DH10]MDG9708929.1 condensation domain-containing protein [Streptomyces sp. DH10]
MSGTGVTHGRPAVAVIGIATRFPQADSLAAFRANLRAGRDSVRPIPPERIRSTGLDPRHDYPEQGYLERIDLFDHEHFGMSRREAEVTDPQHRLALQLTQEALENAGYAPSGLRDSRTAVIFSSPNNGYAPLVREQGTLSMSGNIPCALPARISHVFGFTGPCYGVDTGCNGSLVAVHQACRELGDGDADHAVVGGVSLRHVVPPAATMADFPGISSPTARSRAFDRAADGAGAGEGGGVVLLTTLERAVAEGSFIHAVIRGSAVAHNGRHSATISTPSARSQAQAITKAWRNASLDPATAGYIETHGSGTRLGDAVEAEGLALARPDGDRTVKVGSVKTNIGHLDHAAGIAGLVKAVLSVRHGELYPSLHFEEPADEVDLEGARLEVVTSLEQWDDETRRAGVSSFSLGGVNAHCVVEQPPVTAPVRPAVSAPQLIAVSARSRADLLAQCELLSLELRHTAHSLADVARTLNEGRDHDPYRASVVARDTSELAARLAAEVTWRRLEEGEADQAAATGSPAAPRVVFLLSADATPYEPRDQLPDQLPDELPAPADRAAMVGGQLATYHRLVRAGVSPDGLMSSGISRYTARYLRGDLGAEDTATLRRAHSGQDPAVAGDPLRVEQLHAAADEQLSDGPVVFVELASRGEISDRLTVHLHDRADARVLCLQPGAVDADAAVLELLGRLYEEGVDLDWPVLRAHPSARRVPLPGHPFTGVRCWARPLGEVLPFEEVLRRPTAPAPVPAPVPAPAPAAAEPVRALGEQGTEESRAVVDWLRDTLVELLHADEVPADADYFSIGGNSVIALQLVERVRVRHGVRLKLVDIYDHPVVGSLAQAIHDRAPHAPTPESPSAADAPTAPVVPEMPDSQLPPIVPGGEPVLSYGQERMWFHHQLDPTTTLYNLPGATRYRGPLDVERFRLAWEDLARRHEVLRSNFVEADGRPELVIRPELGDFFTYLDLRGEDAPEAAAGAVISAATRFVFDLADEPLIRVTVVRLGEDDHIVCWCMHHAVNDGWAPQIHMRDLLKFYTARLEDRAPDVEPLPVQYADYARWQRELMADSRLDGELSYWRERLSDPPTLELPTDRPRPSRRDFAGATHGFTIPGSLVHRLRDVGAQETATLFMVLLTALNVLLARWSGQRDIVVGTPTIGRSRPELWDLLGFFNNTVALRSDLSGDPSFRELLRQVRGVVLGALDHQEIPFDKVVREVAVDRDPSRNPLFDVMYVHQTLPPAAAVGEIAVGPAHDPEILTHLPGLPPGTAKFDISMVVGELAGQDDIVVMMEYATQLFDADTISAMSEAFLELLHAVADNENTTYGDLPAGSPPASGPVADVPDTPPAPLVPVATPVVSCLELRGEVRLPELRAALEELAERHEVLRARTAEAVGHGSLLGDGCFTTADVSGESAPLFAAREIAQAEAALVLDPASGHRLHALLATTGPDEHVLLVTTHRQAYDGGQPEVFFRDLLALYGARVDGRRAELPALSGEHTEAWSGPHREDQLAYWRGALTGLADGAPPLDRARPAQGTHATGTLGSRIPDDLAHAVGRSGTRESVLAALTALLVRHTEADEALIGLTGTALPLAATRTRVGPFARSLPLRLDLSDDPSFEKLTDRVRRAITGAEQHRDVPLADIARAAGLPDEPGRAPLFDVAYSYQALPAALGSAAGVEAAPVRWPGTDAGRLTLPPGRSEPDLSWSVVEGPARDELSVSLDYRTELFDRSSARALVEGLIAMLRAATRAPGAPLSGLWPLRTTTSASTPAEPAAARPAHTD